MGQLLELLDFGNLAPLRAAASYNVVTLYNLLGLLDCGALRQLWADTMPDDGAKVPAWNGDPSSFEQFVQDCKWYESSLKQSERNLAASRIWRSLTGAAKSVVRHLSPADFDSQHGLQKMLEVLRASPLQQLPVTDSFARLERWSSMRRTTTESIPQLLVREEERFTELQQSLSRARQERTAMKSTMTGPSASSPPMSPSRSPGIGVGMSYVDESQENASKEMKSDIPIEKDFFGDELRGYRLLKAARLSTQERQSILTLTGNSTRFEEIRRALRTLFADEANEESIKRKNVWWVDPELDQWNHENEELYAEDYMDEWWTADESSYWAGGYEDDGNWDAGGDAYFEPWQSDGWDDSSPTPSDFVKEDTSIPLYISPIEW